MANRDIKNNIKQDVIFNGNINHPHSPTFTNCATLDMQGYNAGLMVTLCANNYINGTYSLSFEDSVDDITFVPISPDKVIGNYFDTITSSNSIGNLPTIGCFSTNRYIRVVLISKGTVGESSCDIIVVASRKGDKLPV